MAVIRRTTDPRFMSNKVVVQNSYLMNMLNIDFGRPRIFGLDLLRSIAILLVVIGHSVHLLPAWIKSIYFNLPIPDGVLIFFVLSGFLIGSILIRITESKGISFRLLFDFWKRRWMRTLPAYYLVLVILIILSFRLVEGFEISDAYLYFIFSQNFSTPHPSFFIEAWSLSIEEWFYLITPLVIFFLVGVLRVNVRKSILLCIGTIIIASILIRFHRYLTTPVITSEIWGAMFRGQVITRLDSLMYGVAGAYCSIYHPELWCKYKKRFLVTGLILILFIFFITLIFFSTSIFYHCNISLVISSLSILLLLPYLSELRNSKGLFFKIITHTSLISYSLYLTHSAIVIVFIVTRIHFLQSGNAGAMLARYLLFWVLTFIFSTLLYKYWELPFLTWRDRKRPPVLKAEMN